MKFSMLVAVDEAGLIAKNGEIPWKCKSDMRFFRLMTTGKTVVMGRKTFDTLGGKPLPNRRNIVVTRTMEPAESDDLMIVDSVERAVELCDNAGHECFVIGGQAIYETFLERGLVDTIYMNEIRAKIQVEGGDRVCRIDRDAFGSWLFHAISHEPDFDAHLYLFFEGPAALERTETWEATLDR